MRLATTLLATLIIAGCGGGGESSPVSPLPPGPPPPPTPSQMSVQAGDGQTGEPGRALSVRPSVVVRSASSAPVSGVTVTFAVDSGAGSIASAVVTTGADGVATAGEWTLGAAEGRNVLLVSAGSLAPVRIASTGRFQEVPLLADQPVPATGGMLKFTRIGDPYDGIEITVPPNAYGAETRWSISASRALALPLPDGAFPVGPAVRVTNGSSYASSVMGLTIPIRAGADTAVGAFYFDESTGTLEAVPIASRTATQLTVGVRHFSASDLLQPVASAGSASLRTAFRAPAFGSVVVVVVGVKPGLLATRVGSSFKPGVDDWEFVNEGSFMYPGGVCSGMSITALYYNYRQRATLGPLYGRFDQVRAFSEDNPQGIRFASLAQDSTVANWPQVSRFENQLAALAKQNALPVDVVNYHSLVVSLFATGRAQYLHVFKPGGVSHAVVAHESNNGTILFADPNFPGQSRQVVFSGGKFQPIQFSAKSKAPQDLITEFRLVGVGALMSLTMLDSAFREFQRKTVAQAYFPQTQLQLWNSLSASWEPFADSAYVRSDTLRVRAFCPICPHTRTATDQGQAVRIHGPNGAPQADDITTLASGAELIVPPQMLTLGFATHAIQVDNGSYIWAYSTFDWRTFQSVVTRVKLVSAHVVKDSTVHFAITNKRSHPAGATYRWTFGAPPGAATANRVNDTTVTHVFTKLGVHAVSVDVKDAKGTLIGRDSMTVNVLPPMSVAIAPSSLIASPGRSKAVTAIVQGTLPTGARFVWTFGDGTKPDTLSVTGHAHTYAAIGTYTIRLTVINNGQVMATATPVTATVSNHAGAWRLTSLTLLSATPLGPGAPSSWRPGWAQIETLMQQVEQLPSDGLIFLEDNQLFRERGVYFQVAPPGTGATAIYWVSGSFFTQLAREATVQFSRYVNTGTLTAGTISGEGYTSALGAVLLNAIDAQKNGNNMTGTMTVGTYEFGGVRRYQFTAVLVTP